MSTGVQVFLIATIAVVAIIAILGFGPNFGK